MSLQDVRHLVLSHGRDVARSIVFSKAEREAVDIAADMFEEEKDRIGITHSGFCLTALPHRRQEICGADGKKSELTIWRREGHNVTLLIESGYDRDLKPIGIPFGPTARIQIIYLLTRAIQTDSPIVEMGQSMHAWFNRVGLPIGGAQYQQVKEQSRRISACRLTFLEEAEKCEVRTNASFVERAISFKQDLDPRQGLLWQDTVKLNPDFFSKVKAHPVPLFEPALKKLASKSMALDTYIWLAYRLHSLQRPTPISWISLFSQFGAGYRDVKHFKPEFRRNLLFATAAYPDANISESDTGLVLHPSRPPVPAATAVSMAGAGGKLQTAGTLTRTRIY